MAAAQNLRMMGWGAMKTVSKEKLLQIADLNADKIEQMTDEQLQDYLDFLKSAVNIFPVQREKLEAALQAMDYAPALQWLKSIRNNLARIQADDLARDCDKHLKINSDLENIRHESLRAFIDYFLANAFMLFADVQQMLEESELEGTGVDKDEELCEKVREKLYTITEIDRGKIEAMTKEELAGHIELLSAFEEDFVAQSTGLKNAVKVRSYPTALQWLGAIEETLLHIHADNLAEDCRNQINNNQDIGSIRHEKFEIFTNYFLTSLEMLSSDIKALGMPKQRSKEQEHSEYEVAVRHDGPEGAKTILAINKMKILLKNLKVILGGFDYSIVGITSLESMLIYLKAESPDLIILDDDFPDMDGRGLIKKIRDMGHKVPIILLTSNITKEYMVKAVGAGAADFIIKPVAAGDVLDKVAAHLAP